MTSAEALRAQPVVVDELTDKNFRRLAELIQTYSGIKMPPSKRTMLESRLRRRVRATGAGDLNAYCARLFEADGHSAETIHLIDAVTTNKTDFFREPAHFEFLATRGLPALAAGEGRRIKAWSAACSTGAEPYTLAMVIEEYGRQTRQPLDYSVLCTDLCTQVLATAVAGIYPEGMIEPVPPALRARYLRSSRDAARNLVRIAPDLREKLAFARLNLMDEAYPVDLDMDLIFCRNILIYFDKPTQTQVLQRLCAHLRLGGYLFLGHSESLVGANLPVRQIANTVFQRI